MRGLSGRAKACRGEGLLHRRADALDQGRFHQVGIRDRQDPARGERCRRHWATFVEYMIEGDDLRLERKGDALIVHARYIARWVGALVGRLRVISLLAHLRDWDTQLECACLLVPAADVRCRHRRTEK